MNKNSINGEELYHYGVKGMKWGVTRAKSTYGNNAVSSKRADLKKAKVERRVARSAYNKAFNRADTFSTAGLSPVKKHRMANEKRWNDVYDKAKALNKANAKVKSEKKAYKALKKIEKQQYKDFVKKRSKEILAGESAAGKLWDVLTDGHKIQARIEYGLNQRAKTDRRYRD